MNNSSPTDIYSKIDNLSAVDTINKNMIDVKTKFGIGVNPIENHKLTNLNWILNCRKPIKVRLKLASPKSFIIPLAFIIPKYNEKCRFFTTVNTFWVLQNKKSVIYAMNNERYSKALWENH